MVQANLIGGVKSSIVGSAAHRRRQPLTDVLAQAHRAP
jgi:hypothetical protein